MPWRDSRVPEDGWLRDALVWPYVPEEDEEDDWYWDEDEAYDRVHDARVWDEP